MSVLTKELVQECKQKLLETKMEILNRVKETAQNLVNTTQEKGGDETDIAVRNLAESEAVATQERLGFQLREIELALSRINEGTYGICEETEEAIEVARLKAIPWTRLSIEGAEMREEITRRFAR